MRQALFQPVLPLRYDFLSFPFSKYNPYSSYYIKHRPAPRLAFVITSSFLYIYRNVKLSSEPHFIFENYPHTPLLPTYRSEATMFPSDGNSPEETEFS
jgi:hypothetical protein